jgi:hypothetical protein
VKHFLKYLILTVAIAVVSCDSSEENPQIDSSKDYYPLRQGLFQVYDVLEVVYTLGVPETLKYELKTVISDSFPNAVGGFTYVTQRSKRNEGEQNFAPLDTWSARTDTHEVIVQEENIPFVKIKLPVKKGEDWDGNLYNNFGTDDYFMEDVRVSYALEGESFDDCIVVNQNDNEDFVVFLDQRTEVYARHIGLIYKKSTLLSYCTVGSCLGQQQIESGTIYTQTLKSHGVE